MTASCDHCNIPAGYDGAEMALTGPGMAICTGCWQGLSPQQQADVNAAFLLEDALQDACDFHDAETVRLPPRNVRYYDVRQQASPWKQALALFQLVAALVTFHAALQQEDATLAVCLLVIGIAILSSAVLLIAVKR